jgi:hypothetical protein
MVSSKTNKVGFARLSKARCAGISSLGGEALAKIRRKAAKRL